MRDIRCYGFTLIELMITLVILSVIVAIAYPAYTNYTTQTRRSDAQVALTQTVNRLEKYFSVCNTYPTANPTADPGPLTKPWPTGANSCPTPGDNGSQGLGIPDADSPDGHYTLALAGGLISGAGTIATTYTLTATPTAGGLQVGDGGFRIDSTGRKQWNKKNTGWDHKWTEK